MSTKNCPETPRQKMIGMMYLVLTAMLALNVSADVLDAFTRVQEKMSSTVSGFYKKNAEAYNEIDMAYNLNSTKVAPIRAKALEIKSLSSDIFVFIEELKKKMVLLADGPEGDVMHIQARDNLDIGGQVMITEGEGKKLRELLNRFQEKSLSFIHPKDSLLRVSIRHNLDTEAPKAVDGEFKSWESSKFEGIPLVGVVTMLTFYQANVLSTESDVIRYLYSSIDAESFKFNKLEALVIPDSRYVLTGDRFKARILLAAVDTTQRPDVIVGGRSISYNGDYCLYTESATKVGIHRLKGVINYVSPSGATLPREFSMEYEVADPAVVISPTKMNVFYVGVDNPVSLAAPGLSPDVIEPQISNGEIRKSSDGSYIVRPKVAGRNCEITVFATIDGQKRKLQTQKFRVKEVPDPVAKVGGQRDGKIKKNLLLAAGGVDVEMENFDFDMKFIVQSFSMYTVIDGYAQDQSSRSGSFTGEQLKMIRSLKRNQILVIEQIMVKGPDGSVRKLPSISFKID